MKRSTTAATAALALAMLLVTAPYAARSDDAAEDRDRFELWNNCELIGLHAIAGLPGSGPTAAKEALRERVTTAARSRLRAARLYTDDPLNASLSVAAFDGDLIRLVLVSLFKLVHDPQSEARGHAPTWLTVGGGPTNPLAGLLGEERTSDSIVALVTEKVDEFIDEYLRVNEDACASG